MSERTDVRKLIQKSICFAILFIALMWAPLWIFAPLCFLSIVFIPRFYLVFVPLFLHDVLYGAPVPLFFDFPFVLVLVGVTIFISIEFIRSRVFVNELF